MRNGNFRLPYQRRHSNRTLLSDAKALMGAMGVFLTQQTCKIICNRMQLTSYCSLWCLGVLCYRERRALSAEMIVGGLKQMSWFLQQP